MTVTSWLQVTVAPTADKMRDLLLRLLDANGGLTQQQLGERLVCARQMAAAS